MFMKPCKFGITTSMARGAVGGGRTVIENCIGFYNVFRPKKSLTFEAFDLIGDVSAEI